MKRLQQVLQMIPNRFRLHATQSTTDDEVQNLHLVMAN